MNTTNNLTIDFNNLITLKTQICQDSSNIIMDQWLKSQYNFYTSAFLDQWILIFYFLLGFYISRILYIKTGKKYYIDIPQFPKNTKKPFIEQERIYIFEWFNLLFHYMIHYKIISMALWVMLK